MHVVCIDSSIFGGDRHIVFEVDENGNPKSIVSQESIPETAIVLKSKSQRSCPATDQSLNMMFELEKKFVMLIPDNEKYLNVIRALKQDPQNDVINWSILMNDSDYRTFIKKLVFDVAKTIHSTNSRYFYGTWISTIPVFEALREPTISQELLKKADSSTKVTFENAIIDKFGVCNKIIYDRNLTRTGRMKVVDGINVLTFPKHSRDIFQSVYKKGAIISIDFKSIEARVAWTANGNPCDTDDIYQMINSEFFDSKLDRSIVKLAVLALLYGQGAEALSKEIGCNVENAQKFISLIKNKFGVKELIQRLNVQFELEGFIRNAYGRKILLDNDKSHLMYNSYVQSTAVDVVLLGFLNFLEKLHADVRPLFLIHDEIYVDCPVHLFEHLVKNASNLSVQLHEIIVKLPTKVRIVSKNE